MPPNILFNFEIQVNVYELCKLPSYIKTSNNKNLVKKWVKKFCYFLTYILSELLAWKLKCSGLAPSRKIPARTHHYCLTFLVNVGYERPLTVKLLDEKESRKRWWSCHAIKENSRKVEMTNFSMYDFKNSNKIRWLRNSWRI